MTINLVEKLASGSSSPVQLKSGRYLLAVSGVFDSASVQIHANIGVATATPMTDLLYTGPAAQIVWIPSGTYYAVISTPGASTAINVAVALVSQEVT